MYSFMVRPDHQVNNAAQITLLYRKKDLDIIQIEVI